MKKSVLLASAAIMMCYFTSCGGGKKTEEAPAAAETTTEAATPEYKLMTDLPTVDITTFPKDKEGRYVIFDGKTFNGWRGYDRADVPGAWTIEDGAIKINGSGYISAPEYQVLDNENHPDAKLGKDGNRKSSSLYDMIPAKPQNAKPFGEWNKGKIMCYKGTVVHYLNSDEPVVEYHLWTPQWKEMLDNSKFSKDKWPLAYELLLNCGGANKEGFIGFQDHGDDVWFRNITVKVLD